MVAAAQQIRILIPAERWTPVRNNVFSEVLGRLKETRSAAVYLILFDRAWHSTPKNILWATIADIGRWAGMDQRTAAKCVAELEEQGLVTRVRRGKLRSKTNKPSWSVPLSNFKLAEGSWTPVPRFLVTRYCKASANAVLLVLLLYYQHMKYFNDCWTGVPTLAKRLGWSEPRVRRALTSMSSNSKWAKESDLPWPLARSGDGGRRRHSVRAIEYTKIRRPNGSIKRVNVEVSEEFRERFKIPRPQRAS
jgi:hypothetical protein